MTTRAQREALAQERAELRRQVAAVKRSMRRAGQRRQGAVDWTLTANRKYDPLRGRTPQIDRLTRPQMAALRRRLDAWNGRTIHAAANGEIIAREDFERMSRARARDRRRERAILGKIGNIEMRSGSLAETMSGPGQLGAALGHPRTPLPHQAMSAAAYRKMSQVAAEGARHPNDVDRGRRTIMGMLDRVPGSEALRSRVQALSPAGVLRVRLDPAVMNAIKDIYLSSRTGQVQGVAEVERYLDEAEKIR